MKDKPRKNLSDVCAQDILLKWMYTDSHNHDVYAIHMLANYRKGGIPIGTAKYFPATKEMTLNLQQGINRRLQAVGPME